MILARLLKATPFTHLPRLRGAGATNGGTTSGTARSFTDQRRAAMAWILLFAAGLLEIVWAFTMKRSEGFTRLGPSIVTLVAMAASFGLLSIAMRTLPLGTAYTVWTGIGAVGAFIVGVAVLNEPVTFVRIVAASLIVGGLILMKWSTTA
jgi:quaternary ammonium compound-resistance protein SugE